MKRPPEISISRLAVYYRFLEDFIREEGKEATINSEELARHLDFNPHQIRKDLSYFGKFGERGVGYKSGELRDKIRAILGLGREWNLCICGAGNLGSALLAYRGFRQSHFNIVAIFDNDPDKIGRTMNSIKVYSPREIPAIVRKLKIDIAIICVPSPAVQEIAAKLTIAGVRAILNFAPASMNVPASVKVRNVDLSKELVNLAYYLFSK